LPEPVDPGGQNSLTDQARLEVRYWVATDLPESWGIEVEVLSIGSGIGGLSAGSHCRAGQWRKRLGAGTY